MASTSTLASLSVDLDNKWTYMKMHGLAEWDTYPGYLDVAVPRMLDVFRQHDIRATVFVIGQDASLEENHPYLRMIPEAGHEVGNHSFHHHTWLHTSTVSEIQTDLADAASAIAWATRVQPHGFRAPGYGLSNASVAALLRLGYSYDASSFPNMLGPLAQTFFNVTSRMNREERERRKDTFGTFSNALRPLEPYFWTDPGTDRKLLEIPVTSMPVLRTPIHLTYLLYLSRFNTALAIGYFKAAVTACRLRGVAPSLILHPPDFLGSDDQSGIDFFPGMTLSAQHKVTFIHRVLDILQRHYVVVSMEDFARSLQTTPHAKLQTRAIESAPDTGTVAFTRAVK